MKRSYQGLGLRERGNEIILLTFTLVPKTNYIARIRKIILVYYSNARYIKFGLC